MKTALVTGGAKRIGKAIVTHLASKGWQVAIHCRSSRYEAEALAETLSAQGYPKPVVVTADLADRTAVSTLIDAAATALNSPLSLLVNNASLFENDDIDTLTTDSWDAHMEANLLAPTMLAQQFYKQITPEIQGNIVNIIDQRVWRLNPEFLSYTTSKAALWTLTQTLAQAMAPKVRVNAIGPGPVLASIHQTNDAFDSEARNVPLGYGPTPDEIAKTVDFITTATAMTGQMIALDGGQHLAWQTPDILV